jgi:hypothetical protein
LRFRLTADMAVLQPLLVGIRVLAKSSETLRSRAIDQNFWQRAENLVAVQRDTQHETDVK